MKVLQLSRASRFGGAGIAAYRLHKGLQQIGVDCSVLANHVVQPEPNVVGPGSTKEKIMAKVVPVLDKLPGKFSATPGERVSSSWFPDGLLPRVARLHPDIINIHWVSYGFMKIETLPKFKQPLVWTLHDMWAFAGGEHYVGDSLRYQEGYTANNRPSGESGLDINRWIWKRKKKSWTNLDNLVIATPSRWLGECVQKSDLFRSTRVEVLPNGIDHERFRPMDCKTVREILGLPVDKKLVLFGAGSATSDPRKGFNYLVEALRYLEAKHDVSDYELVVFGSTSGDDTFKMKTHYLGSLNDEISMALVYAAADVFVAPSTEDNLPNTILEALSCGTPCVAFDIGGMPDMIMHEQNGYLAKSFDTVDLAQGLKWVTEDSARWQRLSKAGRSKVVNEYALAVSAQRYLNLYEELLRK